MTTEISIVLPLYNEEENIRPLISSLFKVMERVDKEYEIIAVNDGSNDNSGKILLELVSTYKDVRIITFDKNYGLTASIDAGFKAANGTVVVTIDADLQNEPDDIPLLLEKIKEFDMVCGWRFKRHDPLLKRLSSKVANYVRNKLSVEDINDSACTLKAFRRACLDKIKLYNGFHRFLPTLFKMEGFSVTEVKVRHHPRRRGISKFNIRNRIFVSFIDLLVIVWMKKRLLEYNAIQNQEDLKKS